ncbi:MAG: acetylxylan esterase [Pseudomonadota bacterium]
MVRRRPGFIVLVLVAGVFAACGVDSAGSDQSDIVEGADVLGDGPRALLDATVDADVGGEVPEVIPDLALVDVPIDTPTDLLSDVDIDVVLDVDAADLLHPDVPPDLPPPACGPDPYDGPIGDLWDMPLLIDPSTLDVEIVATWTEGFPPIQLSEIRYTSYQVDACTLSPVRIEAFVAMPLSAVGSSGTLPGVVKAHGLGGNADGNAAKTPARELGVAVLAYSGPGQGLSEGTGSTPDHLFDTIPDPRASWFWEHAVAAIRGLSVLATLPEVDPSRLGMTGYSGGSVATLMVNGVDPRIKAAVPVSACGYLDLAAAATPVPGWEVDLLDAMTEPKTPASPEFQAYVQYLDPKNYLVTAFGETLLINGAQDEFFPIHSMALSFDDLGGAAAGHRMLAIKNWDHGPLAVLYGSEAAEEMIVGSLTAWFHRVFGQDADVAELPPMPLVTIEPWICFDEDTWLVWDCAIAGVTFSGPTGYDVQEVQLHWSVDGSLTYFTWNLQEQGSGIWAAEVGTLDGKFANSAVTFAEVKFKAGGLFGPVFWLTSRPHIPDGFVPNIIPIP